MISLSQKTSIPLASYQEKVVFSLSSIYIIAFIFTPKSLLGSQSMSAMAFTNLSVGFKKCSIDRTRLRALGGRLFFLAFAFGFLALLWSSPSFQEWNLALGSLDFPTFATICGLFVLFSLLFLGFRLWRLGRRFEELEGNLGLLQKVSSDRRSEFGFNGLVCVCCGSKIQSWKGCVCECSKSSKEPVGDTIYSPEWGCRSCIGRKGVKDLLDESEEEEGDEDDEEEEGSDGDEVMKLRKEIEKETRLRVKMVRELEKERRAAASAAKEVMAKITWHQNEKNFLEREARLYHEIAEQKKVNDQQYIERLWWLRGKLESKKGEMKGSSSRWAEDQGQGE